MLTTRTYGSVNITETLLGPRNKALSLLSLLPDPSSVSLAPSGHGALCAAPRQPFQYEKLPLLLFPCLKSLVTPITHQLATSLLLSSRAPSPPATATRLPLRTLTCDFLRVLLYSSPPHLSPFISSLSISSKPSLMPRACHEPALDLVHPWHMAHSSRAGSGTQVRDVAEWTLAKCNDNRRVNGLLFPLLL